MAGKAGAKALIRPWGAHVSVAGGVEKAPARGALAGATAIQIFTKNNNRWSGPGITAGSAAMFREDAARLGVRPVASHAGYLINLASPDDAMLKKSREAFLDEIIRAEQLGIPYLVFHPGAHMGAGEEEGARRAAESLEWAIAMRPNSPVILALETTAGQGTGLGSRFGQLARIMDLARHLGRMSVCVDTCHIFAAGYGLSRKKDYLATFRQFDSEIGLERLALFHVNDSKKPQGSRVDRHTHIGHGYIGLDGFRNLVNDRRFINTPMILETPKGPEGREDVMNLAALKGLIRNRGRRGAGGDS